VPLGAISGKRVYELRDQLKTKHSRSAANGVLKLLRILFDWGLRRDLCDVNPAVKVDNIRRPKDAKVVNRRWRDDELESVLELAPPWLRVAIAVAAYTGMRESDVARVTWNKYNGCEFETRQVKTGGPIWVAARYRLREILDATPRVSAQIVVGVRGRPMSANALGSRFFDWLKSLPAGTLEPGLSFHGLRHTLGTRLAEAGCDAATIACVLGQKTTQMAEHYSRTARRHHLATAAIARIEERDRNEIGKRSGKLPSNSLKRQ
jgi:integrase